MDTPTFLEYAIVFKSRVTDEQHATISRGKEDDWELVQFCCSETMMQMMPSWNLDGPKELLLLEEREHSRFLAAHTAGSTATSSAEETSWKESWDKEFLIICVCDLRSPNHSILGSAIATSYRHVLCMDNSTITENVPQTTHLCEIRYNAQVAPVVRCDQPMPKSAENESSKRWSMQGKLWHRGNETTAQY